jgi:hypothetical protein
MITILISFFLELVCSNLYLKGLFILPAIIYKKKNVNLYLIIFCLLLGLYIDIVFSDILFINTTIYLIINLSMIIFHFKHKILEAYFYLLFYQVLYYIFLILLKVGNYPLIDIISNTILIMPLSSIWIVILEYVYHNNKYQKVKNCKKRKAVFNTNVRKKYWQLFFFVI